MAGADKDVDLLVAIARAALGNGSPEIRLQVVADLVVREVLPHLLGSGGRAGPGLADEVSRREPASGDVIRGSVEPASRQSVDGTERAHAQGSAAQGVVLTRKQSEFALAVRSRLSAIDESEPVSQVLAILLDIQATGRHFLSRSTFSAEQFVDAAVLVVRELRSLDESSDVLYELAGHLLSSSAALSVGELQSVLLISSALSNLERHAEAIRLCLESISHAALLSDDAERRKIFRNAGANGASSVGGHMQELGKNAYVAIAGDLRELSALNRDLVDGELPGNTWEILEPSIPYSHSQAAVITAVNDFANSPIAFDLVSGDRARVDALSVLCTFAANSEQYGPARLFNTGVSIGRSLNGDRANITPDEAGECWLRGLTNGLGFIWSLRLTFPEGLPSSRLSLPLTDEQPLSPTQARFVRSLIENDGLDCLVNFAGAMTDHIRSRHKHSELALPLLASLGLFAEIGARGVGHEEGFRLEGARIAESFRLANIDPEGEVFDFADFEAHFLQYARIGVPEGVLDHLQPRKVSTHQQDDLGDGDFPFTSTFDLSPGSWSRLVAGLLLPLLDAGGEPIRLGRAGVAATWLDRGAEVRAGRVEALVEELGRTRWVELPFEVADLPAASGDITRSLDPLISRLMALGSETAPVR